MTTVQITKDNFKETIETHPMVIFDFWASWCGPCRLFAPVFERASEEHPDIVFGKIDTEAEPELAGALRIQAIPTLMVFKQGTPVFAQAGALPAPALTKLIEELRALEVPKDGAKKRRVS